MARRSEARWYITSEVARTTLLSRRTCGAVKTCTKVPISPHCNAAATRRNCASSDSAALSTVGATRNITSPTSLEIGLSPPANV